MPDPDQDSAVRPASVRPIVPWPIRALLVTFFLSGFAVVGQVTIIGKQVFDITGRELDLGLLGLAEFLPIAILAPFTGSIADRLDRRWVFAAGLGGEIATSLGLFTYVRSEPTAVLPIFVLVFLFGIARSFASPAARALPIDLAPPEVLERVVALRSVAFQAGIILGPITMGFVFVADPALPYLVAVAALVLASLLLITIPKPTTRKLATSGGRQALRDARAGLRFMRGKPIVFGAISLDLFAVLFGGVIALLPAIAENRLGVGAVGLGWLRAATAVGAGLVSIVLAIRPVRHHVGRVLLASIAVFGLMTITIGLTTSYAVVFGALVIAGGVDAVSVYVRSTIVPLATPEEMRGRVLAVENVFIGASNELGAFESGLTAAAFGLAGAVLFGGVGTLAVVAIWWRYFPALRDLDSFSEARAVAAAGD